MEPFDLEETSRAASDDLIGDFILFDQRISERQAAKAAAMAAEQARKKAEAEESKRAQVLLDKQQQMTRIGFSCEEPAAKLSREVYTLTRTAVSFAGLCFIFLAVIEASHTLFLGAFLGAAFLCAALVFTARQINFADLLRRRIHDRLMLTVFKREEEAKERQARGQNGIVLP